MGAFSVRSLRSGTAAFWATKALQSFPTVRRCRESLRVGKGRPERTGGRRARPESADLLRVWWSHAVSLKLEASQKLVKVLMLDYG